VFFSALDHFLLTALESFFKAPFFLVTLFPFSAATLALVDIVVTEIAIFVHSHHFFHLLFNN